MKSQQGQQDRRSGVTGLAIPAFLLIGLGVGLVIGSVAAGTLIGLGCGFLAMMILRAGLGEW